jgi:hypothetical protein
MSTGLKRRRAYVIQDPSGEYAREFIRILFLKFGLRAICLYTDSWERFRTEREHPILRSNLIEATYEYQDLTEFAVAIRDRYEVVAVIPHIEPLVEPAATLCELLDIDWNPAECLRTFRDKVAQKRQLAAAGVRVPHLMPIASPADLTYPELPERFVIKPVDGYGNRMIGVLSKGELQAARAHIEAQPGVRWMLEEFIAGPEFSINGQVRSGGQVEVHGITEYRRCSVGSCHTVYDYEFMCASTHPQFHVLLEFAAATIRATGLRRSPFHLEVIVDERGPCVIDLGARLGGGLAGMLSRAHPEMPDVLTIAAHDYVEPNAFALGAVSWDRHDRLLTMAVYGLALEKTVIHSLAGLDEVEAMPEFINWITRPEIGDKVFPTDHLYSAPFMLDVWAPDSEAERRGLVERIRATIRWNDKPSALAARAALLRRKAARLPRRLAWLLQKSLGSTRRP